MDPSGLHNENGSLHTGSLSASDRLLLRILALPGMPEFDKQETENLLFLNRLVSATGLGLDLMHAKAAYRMLGKASPRGLAYDRFHCNREWFEQRDLESLLDQSTLEQERGLIPGNLCSLLPLDEDQIFVGPNKNIESITREMHADFGGETIPFEDYIRWAPDLLRCRVSFADLRTLEKAAATILDAVDDNCSHYPGIVRFQNLYTTRMDCGVTSRFLYRAVHFMVATGPNQGFEVQLHTNHSLARCKLTHRFLTGAVEIQDSETEACVRGVSIKANLADYQEYLASCSLES